MNASVLIRATPRWLTAADPQLGERPVALRLAAYRDQVRACGLRRTEEFRLRERAGLLYQIEQVFRPIPRHRALVAVSGIDHHERHPLSST